LKSISILAGSCFWTVAFGLLIAAPARADLFDKLERGAACLNTGECANKKLGALVKTQKCMEAGNCEAVANEAYANNKDKIHALGAKAKAALDKKAQYDACLNETDQEKIKACNQMASADYEGFKARSREKSRIKQEEEAKVAAQYRWDGGTGGDVRLCTRGKDKPMATVLQVTPSKVLVEVTQGGGNFLTQYSTGQRVWLNKDQIGC
jgi:hypothetical protein